MLTRTHHEAFAQSGLFKLEGFLPAEKVAAARELIVARLSEAGCWNDGGWIDAAGAQPLKRALKGLSKTKAFKALATDEVLSTARELVGGEEVRLMAPMTQLLFTAPNATEWTVPHNIWHVDYARLGDLGAPGVQMFGFIDSVRPGGGGTLLLSGSHRLLNDVGVLGSKEIKRRLEREPYFQALTDRQAPNRRRLCDEVGYVNGVPLKVVELTGEPGDVYFTDLRLLHSLGPNARTTPRMMVTQRLPRAAVADQMMDAYAELRDARQMRRA